MILETVAICSIFIGIFLILLSVPTLNKNILLIGGIFLILGVYMTPTTKTTPNTALIQSYYSQDEIDIHEVKTIGDAKIYEVERLTPAGIITEKLSINNGTITVFQDTICLDRKVN